MRRLTYCYLHCMHYIHIQTHTLIQYIHTYILYTHINKYACKYIHICVHTRLYRIVYSIKRKKSLVKCLVISQIFSKYVDYTNVY